MLALLNSEYEECTKNQLTFGQITTFYLY